VFGRRRSLELKIDFDQGRDQIAPVAFILGSQGLPFWLELKPPQPYVLTMKG
jgi:hypothetical protein